MTLAAAHRGYEYQDLLVALRLVDVMLGSIEQIYIDEKLIPNDRFDDLTTVDATGRRERIQVKHIDNADQPLTAPTFTNDARGLRLNHLISVVLADRDSGSAQTKESFFRIVMRDAPPTHTGLLSVLRPADPDPGPFLPGMDTVRMRFSSEALWEQRGTATGKPLGDTPLPNFLQEGNKEFTHPDLDWVCQRLIVEVAAPAASLDLTRPAAAERLLLDRVRNEVGAGIYPNSDRTAVDVAEALVRSARAARQGSLTVTASELLRQTRLRSDFGAVARAHPVDRATEIPRTPTVAELIQTATAAADSGKVLLLVGPPGQGKSWICQQLVHRLLNEKWLVAEHYCYLGDADGKRRPRVLAEVIFGSLLRRIAEQDPTLVAEQRPRFAATDHALEDAVVAALRNEPDRRVAVLVDGIDHVTRILANGPGADPSFALAEGLASVALPIGSVLIVLSQPGKHLEPLEAAGAISVSVPRLTDEELRLLSTRLGVMSGEVSNAKPVQNHSAPLVDEEACNKFVATLSRRSVGNALYATYLCREVLRKPPTITDASAAVLALPQFDGSLEDYYRHIQTALGDKAASVADVIALLDFPVSRSELEEILPDMAHRVEPALDVLKPVLSERATQAGVRIYHESFARFLRLPFRDKAGIRVALLDRIITWLESRGTFEDSRSFRFLIPILADAGYDQKVVDAVDRDFVVRAVASGFPASTIVKNLAVAVGSASRLGNWPAVTRYVEMSRAAEHYQWGEFEPVLVRHMDVIRALLGADMVAERMLHDGRPTLAPRSGIQVCAALDADGAVAPWREYMSAFATETKEDDTIYDQETDSEISVAWMRGRLRLASLKRGDDSVSNPGYSPSDFGGGRDGSLDEPVNWENLAKLLDAEGLPVVEVISSVVDTFGLSTVIEFIDKLDHPGTACLALAEEIEAGTAPDSEGSALYWASRAVTGGLPTGSASRLIAIGLEVDDIDAPPVNAVRERLLNLARELQDRSSIGETEQFHEWLDACAVAAIKDSFGLNAAEAALDGPGWYTCWLRFTISLVIAEMASPGERSRSSLEALRILTEVEDPFLGEPRACDLYFIHGLIDETIRRAVHLLDDSDWAEALEVLKRVSDAVSTTIRGELGGPLPPDRLLDFVVETATPKRKNIARRFVSEIINDGGHGRYYSDLAEYRLVAARLELNAGDASTAERHWIEACRLLIAYGWRRDTTIYELLDPLPTLITIDRARGRTAVAKVQPLCERVLEHTDGKDTRHVGSRWWRLLAAADPCALSRLVQRRILSSCNDPNDTLHGARSDMWRAWHRRADPIVAGALRLTLEEPLDQIDLTALDLLANMCDGKGSDAPSRLMIALLARIDERPFTYSHSDSSKDLARDRERVDAINLIATRAGLPNIAPLPVRPDEPNDPNAPHGLHQRSPAITGTPNQTTMMFRPGAVGIAQAIRVWQGRLYREEFPKWSVERFANIVGYRIIELVEGGHKEDAETALRMISDPTGFGDSPNLLNALAEGLERQGQDGLAAEAYTLAWTRSRSRGGWLRFGGKAEIEALQRAAQLDRGLALQTIAEEIEQVVSRGLGALGITQSLMYGFAMGGLGVSDAEAMDIWEEAFSVIEERLPRVAATDDPDDVYIPPDPDSGADVPGDVDIAFAAAAIAGLAHPGREQKRRSLVAVKVLIDERPSVFAAAIEPALAILSDPATLTWLLRMIELSRENARSTISECDAVLAKLMERPHLTVRALSRRLLPHRQVPLPRSDEPDVELLDRHPPALILPAGSTVDLENSAELDGMIDEVAGARLSRAERIYPRLREALRKRVLSIQKDEVIARRMEIQFRAYGDHLRERWPDGFLAINEAVEDAIQRAAAGVRSAQLMNGEPVADPAAFEDQLAGALIDDPELALAIERTRQPRPDIPPPPQRDHKIWDALQGRARSSTVDHSEVEATSQDGGGPSGTVAILDIEGVPSVLGGPFSGWKLVATVERRLISRPEWRDKKDDIAERYRNIELRQSEDQKALDFPPIAIGNLLTWKSAPVPFLIEKERIQTRPIIGFDWRMLAADDGYNGLGFQKLMLTPTPWLSAALELERGTYFILEDSEGPAVAFITWRSEYETSDYCLAWPRLHGAGLVVRSDAFGKLVHAAQGQLIYRDFLASTATLELTPPG